MVSRPQDLLRRLRGRLTRVDLGQVDLRKEWAALRRTGLDLTRVARGQAHRTTPRPRPTTVDRAVVGASLETVAGWVPGHLGPEDVIALAVVKDAAEHVEALLDHHLGLGVRGVVLLDNGSTDETVELARRYAPVLILRSTLPFRTYVHTFRCVLRERYGRGCWSLMVDADERFEYPASERLSLGRLARHLNAQGANLVLANLLGTFAQGPLLELPEARGNAQARLHRFYDLTDLEGAPPPEHLQPPPGLTVFTGGIRQRALGWGRGYLHKFPLAFFRGGLEPWDLTGHHVHGPHGRLADLSGVLYHYRFTSSLATQSERGRAARSYANESEKLDAYLTALAAEPSLDLHARAPAPQVVRGPAPLLAAGFLHASPAFLEHAAREGRDRKVFCIGFHKTGTTSMGALFRALGYRALSAYRTRDPAFVADLAAGRLDDLFAMADRAQAFEDNPWPLFYRALDARYPGSRFILTVRDTDRWLKSLVNHFGGQDAPDSPMRAFIYGPGRGDPRGHEAAYRARYEAHRAEVEAYFAGRPQDLLVVDVSAQDALQRICDFLGHPPPFAQMPHENRRQG